jgi:ABC-type tungstate transport system permease subunit
MKKYYLFRDHFILTGPLENPANINDTMDVTTIFARLFQSADLNNATTPVPTRFLSRYDKSATNLKESQLWLGIGQVSVLFTWKIFVLNVQGSMGITILHVVPPIHRVSYSGFDHGYSTQGVHADRPWNLLVVTE